MISAQGSVFFVKVSRSLRNITSGEYVLKIYQRRAQDRSYTTEINTLEAIEKLCRQRKQATGTAVEAKGFPKIISVIEGTEQMEILMKANGPSLKTLLS